MYVASQFLRRYTVARSQTGHSPQVFERTRCSRIEFSILCK